MYLGSCFKAEKEKNMLNHKPGNSLNLLPDKENELEACIRLMPKWGFGLSHKEIQEVYRFIQVNIKDSSGTVSYLRNNCRFKHKTSADDWIRLLLERHHLSPKKKATLGKARLLATEDPFIISEFYDLL